jgi:hypothetical protein
MPLYPGFIPSAVWQESVNIGGSSARSAKIARDLLRRGLSSGALSKVEAEALRVRIAVCEETHATESQHGKAISVKHEGTRLRVSVQLTQDIQLVDGGLR